MKTAYFYLIFQLLYSVASGQHLLLLKNYRCILPVNPRTYINVVFPYFAIFNFTWTENFCDSVSAFLEGEEVCTEANRFWKGIGEYLSIILYLIENDVFLDNLVSIFYKIIKYITYLFLILNWACNHPNVSKSETQRAQ